MAPYDEWNRIDEDDEDELQDTSVSRVHLPCMGYVT